MPIHKLGKSKSLPTAYIQISLSETAWARSLTKSSNINWNDLLDRDQFGFRENHPTTQQLFDIIDTIISNKQNNQLSLDSVSLDLEKALDTIYTDGLIRRLYEMKFLIRPIQLVNSYTHNRIYYVQANHQTSTTRPITAGVPQGSVFGPFLFSLCIGCITVTCGFKFCAKRLEVVGEKWGWYHWKRDIPKFRFSLG
jgi:Reverse transcriptase (RNA-dependent DNA polymerase).